MLFEFAICAVATELFVTYQEVFEVYCLYVLRSQNGGTPTTALARFRCSDQIRGGHMADVPPSPPFTTTPWTLASICKSASKAVLGRMKLNLRNSPNTSRRFAPGATSNVCLVDEKSDVLRPGIVGMRGYLTCPYDYSTAMHDMSIPPPRLRCVLHKPVNLPVI